MQTLSDNSSAEKVPDPTFVPELAITLSDSELQALAKDIGLTRWKPERWRAMGKIGDFLQQEGAVRVAAGELVVSNDIRMEAVEECQKRLRTAKDAESFAMIVSQLNALLGGKDKATEQLIGMVDSGQIRDPKTKTGPRLPARGQAILIQNNTTIMAPERGSG